MVAVIVPNDFWQIDSWPTLTFRSTILEGSYKVLRQLIYLFILFPPCRDRVLDLVITNVPDRVRVREVLSPKESDVFTDHGMVSFEFHASTKATHRVKRTDMS